MSFGSLNPSEVFPMWMDDPVVNIFFSFFFFQRTQTSYKHQVAWLQYWQGMDLILVWANS